jgi:DNA-binding transcriptional MerR regulator
VGRVFSSVKFRSVHGVGPVTAPGWENLEKEAQRCAEADHGRRRSGRCSHGCGTDPDHVTLYPYVKVGIRGVKPMPDPTRERLLSTETAATHLMQIGELADRTGLSLRTIRHYDEEGLLTPSARSSGGFRLYSADDLERLMVIRRMKPLGFSIDEMRELLAVIHGLAGSSLPSGERAELLLRLTEFSLMAAERRDHLRTQLERAEEFLARLEQLR